MTLLLVRRHDEYLADSVPLLDRSQLKYILGEHSDECVLLVLLSLLEYYVVLPLLGLLLYKRYSIDVE